MLKKPKFDGEPRPAAPARSPPPGLCCERCASARPYSMPHARPLPCAVTKLLEIHGDSGHDTGAKVTVAGDAPDALGVGEKKEDTVGA